MLVFLLRIKDFCNCHRLPLRDFMASRWQKISSRASFHKAFHRKLHKRKPKMRACGKDRDNFHYSNGAFHVNFFNCFCKSILTRAKKLNWISRFAKLTERQSERWKTKEAIDSFILIKKNFLLRKRQKEEDRISFIGSWIKPFRSQIPPKSILRRLIRFQKALSTKFKGEEIAKLRRAIYFRTLPFRFLLVFCCLTPAISFFFL